MVGSQIGAARNVVPRLLACIGCCLVMVGRLAAAAPTQSRQPVPETRFTFESLGIPSLSPTFVSAGSSMLTVHFVDTSHLLLTYGVRELIPRIPGDPADDDDRIVAGELVELPSGKVLARTRWHLHDHGRYLWNLGEGRFLLREGQALSTFAPLANLGTPDPFFRVPLEYRRGALDAVVVSPDARLLTIETHERKKEKLTGIDINLLTHTGDPIPKPLLYLDFYRISGKGTQASPFVAQHSGLARAAQPIRLPIDADGYLVAAAPKRGRWAVDYQAFGGKGIQVGTVESNCSPGLEFVSQTQWLAFTCRNVSVESMTVAAYDFAQHEIWEEPLGPLNAAPVFALAPGAGRFAMSRPTEVATGGVGADAATAPGQEVRVYGTQTGDLLLKINCLPAFRTAENFDLAPDGMRLVSVRNNAIEIYRLPELTRTDREDLAELQKLVPSVSNAPISLRRFAASAEAMNPNNPMSAEDETMEAGQLPGNTTAAGSTQAPTPANASTPAPESPVGDTEMHRKPPSLLNPGEKPEAQSKSPTPKPE